MLPRHSPCPKFRFYDLRLKSVALAHFPLTQIPECRYNTVYTEGRFALDVGPRKGEEEL
jgi:hypothetical protein